MPVIVGQLGIFRVERECSSRIAYWKHGLLVAFMGKTALHQLPCFHFHLENLQKTFNMHCVAHTPQKQLLKLEGKNMNLAKLPIIIKTAFHVIM